MSTEAAATCMYLADVFPEAGLGPRPEEKANYYRWIMFIAGPWEQASVNQSFGVTSLSSEQQATAGYGTFERTLATLSKKISECTYVCGDRFTAADVYVGGQVGFAVRFGAIEASPAIQEYIDRVEGREAFQRAKELDDAAMARSGGETSQ